MRMRFNICELSIRLQRKGCCNRPFYRIVVARTFDRSIVDGFEQLGTYDPMANERNEKLLSLNVERFQYWVAQGAAVRSQLSILLGLAGILPLHPQGLVYAWNNRREAAEKQKAATENSESQ